MEIIGDRQRPAHAHLRRQAAGDAEHPAARVAHGMAVEMHDLAGRMHAGIGAAGADRFDRMAGDERQRLLERGLDRLLAFALGLAVLAQPLPATEAAAVVFDTEGMASRRRDVSDGYGDHHAVVQLLQHPRRALACGQVAVDHHFAEQLAGAVAIAQVEVGAGQFETLLAGLRRQRRLDAALLSAAATCHAGARRERERWRRVPTSDAAGPARGTTGSSSSTGARGPVPERASARAANGVSPRTTSASDGAAAASVGRRCAEHRLGRATTPQPAADQGQQQHAAADHPRHRRTGLACAVLVALGQALLRGGQFAVLHRDQLLLLALELLEFGDAALEFLQLGLARGQGFGVLLQFLSQHVALTTGVDAGLCPRLGRAAGARRNDFKTCIGAARSRRGGCSGSADRGGSRGCGDAAFQGRLRDRTARIAPLPDLAADQLACLRRIDAGQLLADRDVEHRAGLEPVDVAADEGVGIGAQQGDHRLVEGEPLALQAAGDLRQGVAAADRIFARDLADRSRRRHGAGDLGGFGSGLGDGFGRRRRRNCVVTGGVAVRRPRHRRRPGRSPRRRRRDFRFERPFDGVGCGDHGLLDRPAAAVPRPCAACPAGPSTRAPACPGPSRPRPGRSAAAR